MQSMSLPPEPVAAAFGVLVKNCQPIEIGLINQTFVVHNSLGKDSLILQKLHPIFAPEVNLDIEAITGRLICQGLQSTRLLRTLEGKPWFTENGETWRALTYVPGVTIESISTPEQARAAAHLVGRFHRALDGWNYTFHFTRPNAHNTALHLKRLAQRVALELSGHKPDATIANTANAIEASAIEIAEQILARGQSRPPLPQLLSKRICHGDLKISNVRFEQSSSPVVAHSLIDLDTMGWQLLAYELGDAMRSWCHQGSEDDDNPQFDSQIFAAALTGYCEAVGDTLGEDELKSVVVGTETICLELAARFCLDIFEDDYFGWNPNRFQSRRAHNLARARSQLELSKKVQQQAIQLTQIIESLL